MGARLNLTEAVLTRTHNLCIDQKKIHILHVVSASGRVGELVVGEKVPSLSCRVGQLTVGELS